MYALFDITQCIHVHAHNFISPQTLLNLSATLQPLLDGAMKNRDNWHTLAGHKHIESELEVSLTTLNLKFLHAKKTSSGFNFHT